MENYKNSKIGRETVQKYGDILEMERPQTEESLRKHPRMTLQNRAKIFSPFSPLRGYDEQLAAEKQRTERVAKRILTEEEISALSDRLMQVTKGMTITVRYFKEDTAHPEVPAVGNYITLTGKADRIDPVFRTLQVGDTVVPFEDLVEVSGEGDMDVINLGTGLLLPAALPRCGRKAGVKIQTFHQCVYAVVASGKKIQYNGHRDSMGF